MTGRCRLTCSNSASTRGSRPSVERDRGRAFGFVGKRVVEAHGGRIEIGSCGGSVTDFCDHAPPRSLARLLKSNSRPYPVECASPLRRRSREDIVPLEYGINDGRDWLLLMGCHRCGFRIGGGNTVLRQYGDRVARPSLPPITILEPRWRHTVDQKLHRKLCEGERFLGDERDGVCRRVVTRRFELQYLGVLGGVRSLFTRCRQSVRAGTRSPPMH